MTRKHFRLIAEFFRKERKHSNTFANEARIVLIALRFGRMLEKEYPNFDKEKFKNWIVE